MRTLLASLVLLPLFALAQVPPAPDEEAPPRPPPPRPFRPRGSPGRPGPAAQPTPPPAPGTPPPAGAQPPPAAPAPGAPPPPAQTPAPSRPRQGAGEALRPESKCVPLQGRFMLTFNKADIVDVIEQASRWTCRNFVYTDDIARGKITLLSKTPVTAEEAYAAFLVALNSNNIAVYATGRYYKLIRTADAKKNPIPLYTDAESGTPANEQPITKVIRLSYADADQMRGIVSNFVSPQGADVVSVPPDMLIVTDIGLNLRRIERLLEAVDRPGAGDLVRIVQVRFAAAKDIADKVNQIFQAQQGRTGTRRTLLAPGQAGAPARPAPVPQPAPAAPAPAGAAPGQPGVEVSVSKIIPDERTNKLIIIADEKSFQRIIELVDQLDVPTTGTGGIHVVFLRNANAEELAQTLSNLAQGQARARPGVPGGPPAPAGVQPLQYTPPRAPGAAGAPGAPGGAGAAPGAETAELFAGEVKITADKAQNALLIQASGADFAVVQRLIEKLDRPRRQVFVEAVILEVNLRNENQFGVGAHGTIPYTYKGDAALIPIASEPGRVSSLGISNILSAASLGGFLTGFAGPVSAEAKALGLNLPSLGLVIQALQSSSDVNVLSTPHLVATDNEESEITVGQNVPFQAGYAPQGLSSLLAGAPTTATTTTASTIGSLLGTGGLGSLYAPIQRQPVELRLKIKPQINEGGNVRLLMDVQNEEIASTDAVLGPTTSKRSVKTQIVARDQSTIVIGGLIQERTLRSVKKVPFLGSLPVLGWLFRDTVTTKSKTNLLVFLTPYIIRDEADYRRIYERKRKEQQEFVEQFYGRQPAYEVGVDFARKAGPFARMRAGVIEESTKVENGGRGGPGQRITEPPGAEPAPAPAPPGRAPRRPQEAPREEEGTPVDRLDVEPQPSPPAIDLPPPGGPPAGEPPAEPPQPPGGPPSQAPSGEPAPRQE
jgi:general secretion pathway protein D